MDFHAWMLLHLIPLLMIGFLAYKVVRLRRRGRAFLELGRTERLRFAQLVVRDRSLPLLSRMLVTIAAGYLAMPFDLIPDFIPIIGHADDFLVVTVLIGVVTKSIPAERLAALVREARELLNTTRKLVATQPTWDSR